MTYVTEQDLILYRDDPQEYIRKNTDFTETFATPRNSMLDLVTYIMDKDKPKPGEQRETPRPEYLNSFLEYIVKNMTEYAQLSGQADFRIKEALMMQIINLQLYLERYEDLSN